MHVLGDREDSAQEDATDARLAKKEEGNLSLLYSEMPARKYRQKLATQQMVSISLLDQE